MIEKLKPVIVTKNGYEIFITIKIEPVLLSIIFIGAMYQWLGV